MAYIGKTPSQAVRQRYYYTASGSETSLSGADDNSNTLAFSDGEYVDVSLNGVSLVAGTDYNTNTANTIAGLSALAASDVVEIVVYDTFSVHSGTFEGSSTFNGDVTVDNLKIDGNTISSTDTHGDVILEPNGGGDVEFNLGNEDGSVVNLNKTRNDSGEGPVMNFKRTSSSPADGDELGKIVFYGNDSGGNLHSFASLNAKALDVTNGTENGQLVFNVDSTEVMNLRPGRIEFSSEEDLFWATHQGTAYTCILDWETPTSHRTVKLPNATGTLGYVALSTTSITSDTASITLDNLSTAFDTFKIFVNAHPVTDGAYFRARFLDTSGAEISASNTYAHYADFDGTPISNEGDSHMDITSSTIGSGDQEGVVLDMTLTGRNYTTSSAEVVPPTIQGTSVGHYSNSNFSGGVFYGVQTNTNNQAIRGIKLFFSSGDIARATVQVFGIQNT